MALSRYAMHGTRSTTPHALNTQNWLNTTATPPQLALTAPVPADLRNKCAGYHAGSQPCPLPRMCHTTPSRTHPPAAIIARADAAASRASALIGLPSLA
ncbi:hypothetical protein FA95DRAFT_222862 [Auriscalpium vulgare]|uniref:Uncharacterized protein n=1 Tax=Auriscalpium vulgare TaxID=40419 RepID=A0ACB8RKN1_9AGAM|nr:hypothetical protein FA95DRAFT_222862 [Auriscalpium vulgare]